jgi:hypothetical protein
LQSSSTPFAQLVSLATHVRQAPRTHRPVAQVAPWQAASTQPPFTHAWPDKHAVPAHAAGAHRPCTHCSSSEQAIPTHRAGWHCPSTQTVLFAQVSPGHWRGRQVPPAQAWSAEQVWPTQEAAVQVSLRHTSPGLHAPELQEVGWQVPWTQAEPGSQ